MRENIAAITSLRDQNEARLKSQNEALLEAEVRRAKDAIQKAKDENKASLAKQLKSMEAERIKLNVLHHNHLPIVFLEFGKIEHSHGIHLVATGELLNALRHSRWSALKSFTLSVLTNQMEQTMSDLLKLCILFFHIDVCKKDNLPVAIY